MGFISVLNTTINIIYTFQRQATQEKKIGGERRGEHFDPAVQKKSE